MLKKITSLFLCLFMVMSIFFIVPKPIKVSASTLSEEMADRFINIFYRTNTTLAKEVKNVLTGKTEVAENTAKDIYSKIMSVYKCVDSEFFATVVSEGTANAIKDFNFLTNCVTGFFTVMDNVDSFLESDNAMQKTVDGIQVAIGFLTATQKGSYIAPGLNLVLTATELGLCVGAYLQTKYFEEIAGFYRYRLDIAYWTDSILPYEEAPDIYFQCGVTQKQADEIFAKLYTNYVLKQQFRLLRKGYDLSGDYDTNAQVSNVFFAAPTYTLFYNWILTNPAYTIPYETDNNTLYFYSGDTSIATVDQAGKITPVNPGTVTIYAQADNGVTGSCVITVLPFCATENNNTYTITGYKGYGGAVDLPAYVDGKPIFSIAEKAFMNCNSITSVTIPSTVTSIGDFAFQNCSNLASINIPDSVTCIGEYAFSKCLSFTKISIPSSVKTIGEHVFWDDISLKEVDLGSGIKNISDGLFSGCSSLTTLSVAKDLTNIGSFAFKNCTALTSITIPDSVANIGLAVFNGCSSLESITLPFVGQSETENTFLGYIFGANKYNENYKYIPNSLKKVVLSDKCKKINNCAFINCDSISSITIPDSVTSIGESAFYDCSSLTSVIIPDTVKSIEKNTFRSCSSLTSVTIPNGVITIGEDSFAHCKKLISITIPESVKNIDNNAFFNCGSLSKVNIMDLSSWCKVDFKNNYSNPLFKATKLYINGSLATDITIPEEVTTIKDYAFNNCDSITSITIPDSVTSIGNSAFASCSSLSSVTIPDSVTNIGHYAFNTCSSLTSVSVDPNNISFSSSDGVLFNKDKTLLITYPSGKKNTSYSIPSTVRFIGDGAFTFSTLLTSITIPDSVINIGSHAFSACLSLNNVTLSDNLISIEDYVFSSCRSLSSITIPYGVKNIGEHAFYNCNSLDFLIIPDSVTNIDIYAFSSCENLVLFSNIGKVSDILSQKWYKYKCFGDMNDDKALNGTDTTKMKKALFGIFESDYDEKIADINQDDNFNLLDLIRLKKTIAEVV